MGRAILCLGQYAKIPYTFEKTKTRVFCLEELCFFLKENAGLVDESCFTRELADWIGEQCGLPELAVRLRALMKGKEKPEVIVPQILEYAGCFSEKEIQETGQLIRLSADVSLPEKWKARADYFLENRRYAMAIQEYRRILDEEEKRIPSFDGKLYHNLGVAQAGLFLFEKAADSFETAYRLGGQQPARLSCCKTDASFRAGVSGLSDRAWRVLRSLSEAGGEGDGKKGGLDGQAQQFPDRIHPQRFFRRGRGAVRPPDAAGNRAAHGGIPGLCGGGVKKLRKKAKML